MRNLKGNLLLALGALVVMAAQFGAGSVSPSHFFQPKEPANLKQMFKK
ncbi:MAG: cyclic lactone autoinducer peptide [Clostridiales bacterium]|nr:cyclic lactone autoinducer peptide [Clostridiales bacterium]